MQNNLQHTILLGLMVLALFAIGECLHLYAKVKAEYTRKFIHIGTGLITLLCPLLIDNHWYVLALCASFAGFLILSIKLGFLKSINNIGRKSYGSVAYAAAVYLSFDAFWWQKDRIFFYMPMLILAIADPIAALVGQNFQYGKFKIFKGTKTLSGSVMFFISAFLVAASCIYFHGIYTTDKIIWIPLVLALASAFAEALSGKGLDNITIPIVIIVVMVVLRHFEIGMWERLNFGGL